MDAKYDLKREWEKTRKQLKKFSQEAIDLAQKGEKELIKLSHKSKLHIDSTAITLKKDRLYFLIGKEYTKMKNPSSQTPELKKLMAEYKSLIKEENSLNKKFQNTD